MAETLNTFTGEQQATAPENHDEAMLEKAEQIEQANNPDRPEWLPEKFESPEAMAQAYQQLESKLGSAPSEDADFEEASSEEIAEEVEQEAQEVASALSEKGLDFEDFQQEYLENGGLSEDAYTKLSEAGFGKDLVDSWINGQQAIADKLQNEVFGMAGGEEGYRAMTEWAAANLSPSEVDAFNANIESGDPALTQFAVQGLSARYRSEAGSEPTLLQGQASNNQGGAFNSVAELTAAMGDPRYQKDPAYRKTIADKLARSNVF